MTLSYVFCRMNFVPVHEGPQQSAKIEGKLDRLIHLPFAVLEFLTGICNTGHGYDQNSGFITAPDCSVDPKLDECLTLPQVNCLQILKSE